MQYFRRYIAFCMAFLVFGTSVVFTVDKHICKGEVWSVSYVGKARACKKMEKRADTPVMSCCMSSLKKQPSQGETQISKAPCCSQETFVNNFLNGKERPSVFSSGYIQTALHSDLLQSYLFSVVSVDKEIHVPRPPPDSRNNLQSLFQVFII